MPQNNLNLMQNTLAVILAGGKGTRLDPLTRDRAKPAVPFGGLYRIIDFTLSNCLNSGLRRIVMFTQYKAMSLDRHVNLGWRRMFARDLDEFIDIVPPQQRIDDNWYKGTADAVYQNIYSIERERPEYVVILAGDHIYKMNYRRMVEAHVDRRADLTVAALQVPLAEGRHFGVMHIDNERRITDFVEKPSEPPCIPGDEHNCLASMGIYVFTARFLFEQLLQDANDRTSQHDFGRNIIPSVIGSHRVFAYPFADENSKNSAYWRDVGTLDAYYEASMDLVAVEPVLNMYDERWPIRTHQPNLPPPKFVFGGNWEGERVGHAMDSIVCQGCIVSGGEVVRSILGARVRINSFSRVEDSILNEGVRIGRYARVRRAIIDKDVSVPEHCHIGYDEGHDRARGFTISDKGVVVVAKGTVLES